MTEEQKQAQCDEEKVVDEETSPAPEKKEKKKSKKESEIAKLQDELTQKSDLLIRTAADFDNYKKRTERERLGIAEFAKAGVIKQLLPILDNIDRAVAADHDSEDYLKGVEMIIKQFLTLSGALGIVEIGKVGDLFDPNLHEAVMHVEDENLGENVISQVMQKGYKLGDTVIRPAMVQVAN